MKEKPVKALKLFLGDSTTNVETIKSRASQAYEMGCNSLFIASFPEEEIENKHWYAIRKQSGRFVNNPMGWIDKAKKSN